MDEIAKRIHDRRLELGLTLEEVGKAVGVGKSTVRKWENGMIKNMGRDKIALLAKVLQISPIEIVPMEGTFPWEVAADMLEHTMVVMPNAEDQERLEALHQDPRLGLLFDRTRKMSSADVETMLAVAASILKERDGE